MSVGYNPKAVTSGLVIYLDAANRKSYGGTGNSWINLTSNNATFTLAAANVGGAQTVSSIYNTANSSLQFDGVDDYLDFYTSNLSSATVCTVEMLCKLNSLGSRMMFGFTGYDIYLSGNGVSYNTGNSDIYGVSSADVSSLGLNGNWAHYMFEMVNNTSQASNPYTANKIYINGVSRTLTQLNGLQSGSTRSFSTGAGRIAGWKNDNNYRGHFDCSFFKIYNRALTPAEIQQSFNVVRGRVGI